MAQTTRNLAITKSGYVRQAYPNTVFPTSGSTNYTVNSDSTAGGAPVRENFMYFGFEALPSSLQYNILYSLTPYLYIHNGIPALHVYYVDDFTPSSLTWNTKPTGSIDAEASFASATIEAGGSWANRAATQTASASTLAYAAKRGLQKRAIRIADGTRDDDHDQFNWYVRTTLANGGTPYMILSYDNALKKTSQAAWGTNGYITANPANAAAAHTLSWYLTMSSSSPSGESLSETWTQASAKLYWRVKNTGSWNQISISGTTMSYTVPARTFPTGKTIEYYVSVTDNDGTTTQTATKEATFAASQIYAQNVPTSGYVNPRNAVSFGWYFSTQNTTIPGSGVKLYWKKSTAATYTEVSAASGATSITIAANTFPTASTIQWYLSGSDYSGAASQTSVYSFSTAAGTATAQCVSPVNSVEDGSAPITLRWNVSSTDGQQPSRIRSAWRKASDPDDQQYWHELFNTTTISNSYTAAAGTFPAGGIRWNIRVWNIDSVEGNRDYAEFTCVVAPDPVQGLSATNAPRTMISWQSEEQQAYEISIDGEVVKKAFGSAVYSWRVVEPLADGQHTISVRVQGTYGLWSQPSSITIDVENQVPAFWEDIELSGRFDTDASLSLISPGDGIGIPSYIQWYRDGEHIAEVYYGSDYTGGPFPFTDRKALGTHEYYAEVWQNSTGFYARSNTVTGTMRSCVKRIRALDDRDGDWLELRLSENSDDSENFQTAQQNVTQHVNGAVWPELERSPFRDRTANYDCAFRCPQEAAAFENLFGKIVILKSRNNEVVIGMLDKLQKKVNAFYISYTFAIQQIHTEALERITA